MVRGGHAHGSVIQAVSVLEILTVNNAANYNITMYLKGHRVALVFESSNITAVPHAAKVVVVNKGLRVGKQLDPELFCLLFHFCKCSVNVFPVRFHFSISPFRF